VDVGTNSFTVAEYVSQMTRHEIRVNHEYQRSPKVWPTAARSYLIETMLLGFPIPKLTLYQRTEVQTRSTIKEIVDGQQRSQAILDFVNDAYRLGANTAYRGRQFSQLDEEDQHKLLSYRIAVDVLVNATEDQIRQLFRRINSFTVPLNKQENRNALYQGVFKWFVVDLVAKYAQSLKVIGVFREQQLSRMMDAELFSELIMALYLGIQTTSQPKIGFFYRDRDATFPEAEGVERLFDEVLGLIMRWPAVHGTALMKPATFYALFLALAHALQPNAHLQAALPRDGRLAIDEAVALANLTAIAEGIESPEENQWLRPFLDAQATGTNTAANRIVRFQWLSQALALPVLP